MFNSILKEFEVPDNYKATFDIEKQNWNVYWRVENLIMSIKLQFDAINFSNSVHDIYNLIVSAKDNYTNIEVSLFEMQNIEHTLRART